MTRQSISKTPVLALIFILAGLSLSSCSDFLIGLQPAPKPRWTFTPAPRGIYNAIVEVEASLGGAEGTIYFSLGGDPRREGTPYASPIRLDRPANHSIQWAYQRSDGSWSAVATTSYYVDPARPQIAGGADHSLLIDTGATLWGSGNNLKGEIGRGAGIGAITGAPARIAEEVAGVWAMGDSSYYLTAAGDLFALADGAPYDLRTGQAGDPTRVPLPAEVRVASMAGYDGAVLVLDTQNQLWAWGRNNNYALGSGAAGELVDPPRIVATEVAQVALTSKFSIFVSTAGEVWKTGTFVIPEYIDGHLSPGDDIVVPSWERIPDISIDAFSVAASNDHIWGDRILILSRDGTPYRISSYEGISAPPDDADPALRQAKAVGANAEGSFFLGADGIIRSVSSSLEPEAGDWTWDKPLVVGRAERAIAGGGGGRHLLALAEGFHDGAADPWIRAFGWGDNGHGQLTGAPTERSRYDTLSPLLEPPR